VAAASAAEPAHDALLLKSEAATVSVKKMKDLLENKEHPKGHAGPKAEH